jgi:hypothetical protein
MIKDLKRRISLWEPDERDEAQMTLSVSMIEKLLAVAEACRVTKVGHTYQSCIEEALAALGEAE